MLIVINTTDCPKEMSRKKDKNISMIIQSLLSVYQYEYQYNFLTAPKANKTFPEEKKTFKRF